MSASKFRAAIVGAGTIFQEHVQAFQGNGVEILGVADVNAERAHAAASTHGIPLATEDWRQLLADGDAEIVDICTPPKYHREIAVAALAAGKHVICEKPLATNLAEVDEILQAETEATGKLLVVHQLRRSTLYQRLRWLVDEGHLGKLRLARVQRYDPPPSKLVQEGTWGSWELAGGGVLMTKAIHQLDLLIALLGTPRRVQAMMNTCFQQIESEDALTANIEFEDGAMANVCVAGQIYGGRGQHFDLIGDAGSFGQPWLLRLKSAGTQQAVLAELDRRFPLPGPPTAGWKFWARKIGGKLGVELFQVQPTNSHMPLFREFLAALEGKGQVPVTGQDGRAAVELCTAIYAAAITRQTIELPLTSSDRFYGGVRQHDYRHTIVD